MFYVSLYYKNKPLCMNTYTIDQIVDYRFGKKEVRESFWLKEI